MGNVADFEGPFGGEYLDATDELKECRYLLSLLETTRLDSGRRRCQLKSEPTAAVGRQLSTEVRGESGR